MSRASDRLPISPAMETFLDELPVETKDDPAFPEVLDRYAGAAISAMTRAKIIGEVKAAKHYREMRGE